MSYRLKNLAVLGVFLVTIGIAIVPKTALAATTEYAPLCSNTFLNEWDWPAKVKTPYVTTPSIKNGGNLTTFNEDTDSYVILRDSSAGALRNLYYLFRGDHITISAENAGGTANGTRFSLRTATGSMTQTQIVSEPTYIKAFKDIWGTSSDNSVVVTEKYTTAYPVSSAVTQPFQYTTSTLNCVYAARNVTYSPYWVDNYNQFSSHIEFTAGSVQENCGALQIGCWVGEIFQGVSDTFLGVGKAIVTGIAELFKPDSGKIGTAFGDFNTTMTNKLGFLAYPITFLVSVLNAFTSTDSTCSTTSCVKSFGNLFGHNFSLNLSQPGVSMGSYWSYFRLFIQGTTILTVVLAIKQRYRGIIHK